jgi:hypothetical protein
LYYEEIKMPSAEYGFMRVITEGVSGLFTFLLIKAVITNSGYGNLAILLNVLSIVAIIGLVDVVPFWSITYLIGWLFGVLLVGPYLMDWWGVLLYSVIGVVFLFIKIGHKLD